LLRANYQPQDSKVARSHSPPIASLARRVGEHGIGK